MKLKDLNFTPAPWHSVEYAGYWELQSGPYYGDPSLLDHVRYENAEHNALLSSRAPEMLEKLKKAEDIIRRTVSGYKWDIENKPEAVDKSDYEHLEELEQTLKEISDLLNS